MGGRSSSASSSFSSVNFLRLWKKKNKKMHQHLGAQSHKRTYMFTCIHEKKKVGGRKKERAPCFLLVSYIVLFLQQV